MAKKSLIIKAQRKPKFPSRLVRRCPLCGRPRGYLRQFGLCRICFRELANKGEIPGVTKASWWHKMDQISNLLTTINNGQLAKKTTISVADYPLNQRVLMLLQRAGVIGELKEDKEKRQLTFKLLKPFRLKQVSTPGRRVYCRAREIARFVKKTESVIISTPKGVMTGEEARKINQGGEVILNFKIDWCPELVAKKLMSLRT